MGHCITAFVGTVEAVQSLLEPIGYASPHCHDLPQGFRLLLCDYNDFLDRSYAYLKQHGVEPSPNPRDYVVQYAQSVCGQHAVGLIETDYFGGMGSQSAICIEKGAAGVFYHDSEKDIQFEQGSLYPMELSSYPINTVLARLGVQRDAGKDEFDSINLSDYRQMPPY